MELSFAPMYYSISYSKIEYFKYILCFMFIKKLVISSFIYTICKIVHFHMYDLLCFILYRSFVWCLSFISYSKIEYFKYIFCFMFIKKLVISSFIYTICKIVHFHMYDLLCFILYIFCMVLIFYFLYVWSFMFYIIYILFPKIVH